MALFGDLARLADELAFEGGRLKKRAAIAEEIGRIAGARTPAELEDAGRFAMYLAGLQFAEADMRKLNAGGALLSKALLRVSGAPDAALTAAYRRHGDLGAAAFDLLVPKDAGKLLAPKDAGKPAVVTYAEVAEAFAGMAVAKTTAIRAELVERLLGRATAVEAKYLLKLMLGDMRIGVKQALVEEAIAMASGAEVGAVRHAVMLEADLAGAVRRAFEGTLAEARMRLFHPLGFMLASPVETPEEAIERFTAKPPKPEKPGPKVKPGPEEKPSPKVKSGPKVKPGRGRRAEAALVQDGASEEFAEASQLDTIALAPGAEEEPVAEAAAAAVQETVSSPEPGPEPSLEPILESIVEPIVAFLEDKYDGMRAQIHCGDPEQPGRVAIYSRNREDITESFPELVEAFAQVGQMTEGGMSGVVGGLILDGEILGWDLAQARALPFAVLGQRIGRKRVSNEVRRQIPVVFMAFDLMFAEGGLQLELPLRERRNRLEALAEELSEIVCSPLEGAELHQPKGKTAPKFPSGQGALFLSREDAPEIASGRQPGTSPGVNRLLLSPSRLVESAADIDRAYADARARANEGVMLKAANSAYLPGRRGLAWVKLKRELATLDVVITGAEFGSGRRAQFLSDYTFAVRGAGGELVNVGKAYSGVTDAEIAELTEWLKAHTLEDFGHFRTVEPEIVLEVAFNNIMRSDRHASGYALRFPRILRIRTDKPLQEIDSVRRVEEVYQSQVDKPAEQAAGDEQPVK